MDLTGRSSRSAVTGGQKEGVPGGGQLSHWCPGHYGGVFHTLSVDVQAAGEYGALKFTA